MALILALSRKRQEDDPAGLALAGSIVDDGLDWERLFLKSLWHKVAFIVLQNLIELGLVDRALSTGNLPLLLLNHWKQLAAANDYRNRLQLDVLDGLERALASANVQCVVAKGGPLLVPSCYSRKERKIYDLDFLCDRNDKGQVERVFVDEGFVIGSYSHRDRSLRPLTSAEIRPWLLHARGLPNFVLKLDDPFVEYIVAQVQFGIGVGRDQRPLSIFDIQDRLAVDGHRRRIGEVDTFISLCLHLARETESELFSGWGMDWNVIKITDVVRCADIIVVTEGHDLADRARQLGVHAPVARAIAICTLIMPTPAIARLQQALPMDEAARGRLPTISQLAIAMSRLCFTPAITKWDEMVGTKTT